MRLITVVLFRVGQAFARVARMFNHLAAGTLRLEDLRAGTERTWEQFSALDANVASGLMAWEHQQVSRFVKSTDRVLLVGSGPSRDFIPLVERGLQVTGLEPARRAIADARRQLERRGLSAEIIEGFVEDVALTGEFDVIMFSHCCYSLIAQSERRIAVLRKTAAHLAPDGRILISYMTGESAHPFLLSLVRFAASISRSDWRPERGDVLDPVDPARPLFHYEHKFTPEEIDAEASAAGLSVIFRRVPADLSVFVDQDPGVVVLAHSERPDRADLSRSLGHDRFGCS